MSFQYSKGKPISFSDCSIYIHTSTSFISHLCNYFYSSELRTLFWLLILAAQTGWGIKTASVYGVLHVCVPRTGVPYNLCLCPKNLCPIQLMSVSQEPVSRTTYVCVPRTCVPYNLCLCPVQLMSVSRTRYSV